jgi:hypothetical protein
MCQREISGQILRRLFAIFRRRLKPINAKLLCFFVCEHNQIVLSRRHAEPSLVPVAGGRRRNIQPAV